MDPVLVAEVASSFARPALPCACGLRCGFQVKQRLRVAPDTPMPRDRGWRHGGRVGFGRCKILWWLLGHGSKHVIELVGAGVGVIGGRAVGHADL